METPIYLKESEEMVPSSPEWPQDRLFYLVTSEGLMKCRTTEFFRSCVKSNSNLSELEAQKPFVKLRYPKVPQEMLETVAGFFSAVQKKYDSEAYVCLLWNKNEKKYEIVCPPQEISGGHVSYDLPPQPPHMLLVGDIHSHVNMAAFASGTDENDETQRPGVHIVLGRISQEPPEFHIEVVVDGTRFGVKEEMMLEGYEKRREFPPEWMDQLKKKTWGNHVNPAGTLAGFRQGVGEYEGAHNNWGHWD
jgi:PRTRC genetic system protein A